jgi:hypothetical protein
MLVRDPELGHEALEIGGGQQHVVAAVDVAANVLETQSNRPRNVARGVRLRISKIHDRETRIVKVAFQPLRADQKSGWDGPYSLSDQFYGCRRHRIFRAGNENTHAVKRLAM